MDTTLNFVLGSVSSLGAILLGFGIYTILKINKRIKELEKLPQLINNLEDQARGDFKATHHSIDSLRTILSNEIVLLNSGLRSYIDSRLDKLTSNITNEIVDLRKENHELRKLVEEIASDHSGRLATLETFKKIDDDKIEQIVRFNS
jgi:hypothetical protein